MQQRRHGHTRSLETANGRIASLHIGRLAAVGLGTARFRLSEAGVITVRVAVGRPSVDGRNQAR